MGAVRPSILSPAVNVVIFQCPWGARPRKRSPRRARPLSLIILVAQPVSSTKISFSGSRRAWPSRQSWRASATSGRCCSLARTVFFEREPHTQQKTRHSAFAGLYALPRKFDAKLFQRNIGLLLDPRPQPIRVLGQWRSASASMRLGLRPALAAKDLHPFDCGRGAHIEDLGLRPRRPAPLNRTNQSNAQILRISHRCPRLEQGQTQLLRPLCESLPIQLIREPL